MSQNCLLLEGLVLRRVSDAEIIFFARRYDVDVYGFPVRVPDYSRLPVSQLCLLVENDALGTSLGQIQNFIGRSRAADTSSRPRSAGGTPRLLGPAPWGLCAGSPGFQLLPWALPVARRPASWALPAPGAVACSHWGLMSIFLEPIVLVATFSAV